MAIDPQLLKQYATLRLQIEKEEKELEVLKDHIVGAMIEDDTRKVAIDEGTFTLAERAKWEYTPAVKELETKVKEEKKLEEKSGLAKATTLSYLTFSK